MDVIVENIPEEARSEPIKSAEAAARTENIAHYALAPRFDIQTPNKTEDGKLAEIWAYAKGMAKSEHIPDVIWEVIHLESILGSPRLGESRLDRLYRYAKLKRQEAQIQSEIKNVAGSHNL